MFSYARAAALLFSCVSLVRAHQAAWAKGMYCVNGASDVENENAYVPVTPLYQLSKAEWWLHNNTACLNYPPPDGEFLELPAGGDFTIEVATNRAHTTLSYNGTYTSEWPDGNTYPDDYNDPDCITSPNLHTQNQSMAAGTAFAISYNSDLTAVTAENLVVFSVRYHTPWKRVTTYDVPAALPACPAGGCTCAWGWIPNGCGQPNMYHQAFKCNVTGATGTVAVGTGQPPVWCEDDASNCTSGPKQMLYWNQNSGNNIEVDGYDLAGSPKSPAYNAKCGFQEGAQDDIFTGESLVNTGSSSSAVVVSSSSSVASTSVAVSSSTISTSTSTSSVVSASSAIKSIYSTVPTSVVTTSSASPSSSAAAVSLSSSVAYTSAPVSSSAIPTSVSSNVAASSATGSIYSIAPTSSAVPSSSVTPSSSAPYSVSSSDTESALPASSTTGTCKRRRRRSLHSHRRRVESW